MKKVKLELPPMTYRTRETLKTLRTNLLFCGDDKRVIMLTSCVPGEGKTMNAMELAYTFTELNKSVILVDADLRKSVMAARFQIQGADNGLSHFLSGQCTLSDAVAATNIPKLHLVLSGPLVPNPTELLSTRRFKKMIESFRQVYDYVIIDTAPLGMVIDGAIIAKECDGAVLVIESGKTKYRLAQTTKDKIEHSGCSVLGVILNKVDRRKQGSYYTRYYGKQGYGEYYHTEDGKKEETAAESKAVEVKNGAEG